jgi:hypothetical protein
MPNNLGLSDTPPAIMVSVPTTTVPLDESGISTAQVTNLPQPK